MTGDAFQSQVLSAVHDAVVVVDDTMSVTFWNEAAEEITGWSAKEAMFISGKEVFRRLGAGSFWDDSTAYCHVAGSFAGETAARRKDGSPLLLDIYMKRIYGPGGRFSGAVYTFQDIAVSKRAEETLRNSEVQLMHLSRILTAEVEALRIFHQINTRFIRQEEISSVYSDILNAAISLTNADCGSIQITSGDGTILDIVAHSGYSDDFLRRYHWISGIGTSCLKAMECKARMIEEDMPHSQMFSEEDRRFLESEGLVCMQAAPMFSGAGNLLGIMSTEYKSPHRFNERELRILDMLARQAADVIDSFRMEKALQQSEAQARQLAEALDKKNRLVTDFFINISHEFKTPLTILMLGLELLETKAKRVNGGEAFIGNLTAMKQNSYRLNRLVGNLLDITKLDAGFMQPTWENADIASLLSTLAQSVEPYAWQRQLSLEYACEPAVIPLMTDGFMLERIVLNLLSNAIKHTPAGGNIRITCRAGKLGVSIAVQDTGEGIPDDKKAMIFDRFSQVDTRMTRASEGTGIGLALAQSLAELLGGRITVESELGRGSVFTLELPYVKRAVSKVEAEKGTIQMAKRVQMELSDVMQ